MTRFLIIIALFLLNYFNGQVYAADCIPSNSSMSEQQLTEIQQACQVQVSAKGSEITNLKQAISTFNSKINLAQAQINQTQTQIDAIEKEINILGGVLDTVNQSTSLLTQIYLARVREAYRRSRVDQTSLVFGANSFSDYFVKLKYLNTVKAKDQLILTELENAKQDYDRRKQDKVTKQKEIEKLKDKLESQKKVLGQQQKDKLNLLTLTQNDQRKFEEILRQANSQIAAMRGFTSGATPLNNQTHHDSWGTYYNQRDSAWFSHTIGNSSETLGRVGCLITSSAMVASHYGKSITPSDIAGSTNPFYANTAYMVFNSWSVSGVTVSRTSISKDKIDDEINVGRPVIAGLNTSVGTHFIVIKGKNDKGYVMNDPYMDNGYDKPFSDTYSWSQIFRIDKVSVN